MIFGKTRKHPGSYGGINGNSWKEDIKMVQRLLRKRILITGSTGFIGANLACFLADKGLSPHIFVRKDSNLWRISDILKKLKPHTVDLNDEAKTRGIILKLKPQIIFHCAVYGGYHFQLDSKKIIQTNMFGTMNLLNACVKSGFECFVNTGSSSEYGLKNMPIRESDLLEPVTDYGLAKAMATLFCQQSARNKDLPIATLRLFSPYGYFEDPRRLVASLILSCLNQQTPKLSCAHPVRDFVFIDDVIQAYLKTVFSISRAAGSIINIAGGKQYSVGEVAVKIIKLAGLKDKPIWGSVKNPRLEPSRWVADISRARELLGWNPEFSLTNGLIKTIEWFRNNKASYYDKA